MWLFIKNTMGSIMNAKYAGTCQFCGDSWAVGTKIFYQKTPKAICCAEKCFTDQGGVVSEWKPKTQGSRQDEAVKIVLPDVPIPDGVKTCAEMVQQCIVVAHHLTKSMYPSLNEETHTFGQIRSKLTDQILSVCHLTKN